MKEERLWAYSQTNLAQLLKISLADLMTFESDMLSPDVQVIIDLCRILKCTSDYLFGFSTDPKKTRNLQ